MKNQVIEVLDIEHGKKVIEYWKSMGFSTTGRNADQTKKSCDTYRYYGVIDNVFDNYNLTKVKNYNAEIIELPTELKNTECVAINEQKNALPSTIEFTPNEDIIFLTHEKERLEKELKEARDANQTLSAMNESLTLSNKKLQDDKDYWFEESQKIQKKFDKFKNAVQSVVLFID